jgi:hypothetical protein
MKSNIKVILYIGFLLLMISSALYIKLKYTEVYYVQGTCMEKITTQDRDGHKTYYKILVKYSDNYVEELEVSPSEYISYEKGKTYNMRKTRYNFKQK